MQNFSLRRPVLVTQLHNIDYSSLRLTKTVLQQVQSSKAVLCQQLQGRNSSSSTADMPDWAEQVLTWEEVRQYIDEGTVESLGKLRRSEQQLTTYRSFMDKVRHGLRSAFVMILY